MTNMASHILQPGDFAHYPPQGKKVAVEHLPLLRELPNTTVLLNERRSLGAIIQKAFRLSRGEHVQTAGAVREQTAYPQLPIGTGTR